MTRVLVGGVGYRNLRDHSFGVVLIEALAAREWPPAVSVEDISYNPIALVQRLHDDLPDARFDVAIIAGAMQRTGRRPGTLSVYRWDNVLPEAGAIHGAITEAVTGIISLDNTLLVARHFNALPDTVVVIELEPEAHEYGDELTPGVAAALARSIELVGELIADPTAAGRMPHGGLVLNRVRHTGIVLQQVPDVRPRIH